MNGDATKSERVAVGRRGSGFRRADGAAGAGAVLDDDGRLHHLAQLVRDHARRPCRCRLRE